MRKIKREITYTVPSWNFCNLDGFTANGRFSKETCRFCVKTKTKNGYKCALTDEVLHSDPTFVHKTQQCGAFFSSTTSTVTKCFTLFNIPKMIAESL